MFTLSVFGTFFIHVRSQSPIYTTEGCQAFATYALIYILLDTLFMDATCHLCATR